MAAIEKLLELIRSKEAKGSYNLLAHDKIYGPEFLLGSRGLTDMTLDEAIAYQIKNGDKAMGAYQFIPSTAKEIKKRLGLKGNEKFNEALQDRMGVNLLEHRKLNKYLNGDISPESFAIHLAKEWASLPLLSELKNVKVGESYYKGVGTNKALLNDEEQGNYKNLLTDLQNNSPAQARKNFAQTDPRRVDGQINEEQKRTNFRVTKKTPPLGIDPDDTATIAEVQKKLGVKTNEIDGVWGGGSLKAYEKSTPELKNNNLPLNTRDVSSTKVVTNTKPTKPVEQEQQPSSVAPPPFDIDPSDTNAIKSIQKISGLSGKDVDGVWGPQSAKAYANKARGAYAQTDPRRTDLTPSNGTIPVREYAQDMRSQPRTEALNPIRNFTAEDMMQQGMGRDRIVEPIRPLERTYDFNTMEDLLMSKGLMPNPLL